MHAILRQIFIFQAFDILFCLEALLPVHAADKDQPTKALISEITVVIGDATLDNQTGIEL